MPSYLGEICEIDRSLFKLKTTLNKNISLDEFHRGLPYEMGDSVFLSDRKLLFLIPTENSKVITKIEEGFFEISVVFRKLIIQKSLEYINTTNFFPTTDKDKVLPAFFNNFCCKEYISKKDGSILLEILGKDVPKDVCKIFYERWLEKHLFRQFKLWNLSEPDVKIILDDSIICGALDIEDIILQLSEFPSRFLCINPNLPDSKIYHINDIFESEKIPRSVISLKKRLFNSPSTYIELDKLTRMSLGKEINRLFKYGLVCFDDNNKVAMISSYKMEDIVSTSIKTKIKRCDYNWSSKPFSFASDISKLTHDQRQAVKMVFHNSISIITGGPGTGKTMVIHSIIKEAMAKGISYHVAAFTGKAVGRVKETAHPQVIETSTIDMMITRGPLHYTFDLLILEEASMITTRHIYKLFSRFNPAMYKIVLVGDLDQIPPLEKGHFFSSLIWSRRVPYIRLNYNFRIDKLYGGDIVRNAQKIINPYRNLKVPIDLDFESPSFNIIKGGMSLLKNILLEISSDIKNFTILSPYNRQVDDINLLVQSILFTNTKDYVEDNKSGLRWFVGDKVMITQNTLSLDLANGDLGYITSIEKNAVFVTLEKDSTTPRKFYLSQEPMIYHNLKHAYCLTINKSQGSEYNIVVLYLTVRDSDDFFLNLNLIYTAITRARKMVWIIVEDPTVLIKACNNKLIVPNEVLKWNIMKAFPTQYEGDLVDNNCISDNDSDFDYDEI